MHESDISALVKDQCSGHTSKYALSDGLSKKIARHTANVIDHIALPCLDVTNQESKDARCAARTDTLP